MRQAETPQRAPDGAAMDLDAMDFGKFCGQRVKRDLSLLGHTRLDPASHTGQFAVAPTIALPQRLQ